MLALCLMLFTTYYALNYARIICRGLPVKLKRKVWQPFLRMSIHKGTTTDEITCFSSASQRRIYAGGLVISLLPKLCVLYTETKLLMFLVVCTLLKIHINKAK